MGICLPVLARVTQLTIPLWSDCATLLANCATDHSFTPHCSVISLLLPLSSTWSLYPGWYLPSQNGGCDKLPSGRDKLPSGRDTQRAHGKSGPYNSRNKLPYR